MRWNADAETGPTMVNWCKQTQSDKEAGELDNLSYDRVVNGTISVHAYSILDPDTMEFA